MMANNGLTKLSEEAAEVIQIAQKMVAFPHTDVHPDGKGSMRRRLEDEIADIEAALAFVKKKLALNRAAIESRAATKFNMFLSWDNDVKATVKPNVTLGQFEIELFNFLSPHAFTPKHVVDNVPLWNIEEVGEYGRSVIDLMDKYLHQTYGARFGVFRPYPAAHMAMVRSSVSPMNLYDHGDLIRIGKATVHATLVHARQVMEKRNHVEAFRIFQSFLPKVWPSV